MSDKILHVVIAGGSGMIGMRLTELLLLQGFRVSHLGRKQKAQSTDTQQVPVYHWNPAELSIDPDAITDADFVVNLAGESIAGKHWTTKRKQAILQSRLSSAKVLEQAINHSHNNVKAIICASAIGIYGDRRDPVNEDSKTGSGFLAATCKHWEKANSNYNVRTVILRFSNVLSTKGGVLSEMIKPLRFGMVPFFGGGSQMFSWIHIDDVCNMIIHCIHKENLKGIYNAVAPQVVSQKYFMLKIKALKKVSAINITVPAWSLKLLLGEMSAIVLAGVNVSSEKIQQSLFAFQYPDINSALSDLLSNE